MSRTMIFLTALGLLASAAAAQQPNTPSASLKIAGQGGPPYPIVGVFAYGGTSAEVKLEGGANVTFCLVQTPNLNPPPGFPLFGGVVDLDISNPANIQYVMNGFTLAPWEFTLDSTGEFVRNIPVPSNVSQGGSVALQAMVQDLGSPSGISLTAAFSVFTAPGLTPLVLNFGSNDDGSVLVNTQSQFGFTIPYYGTSYSGCYVGVNGLITFGSSTTDFTPTNPKMHQGLPKICPFWSDLDHTVAGAGPITATIDQISPATPRLTVKWDNIPDWPVGATGGIGFHTFEVEIDIAPGDVIIRNAANNANSIYDIMIGVSPGNNLSPAGVNSVDLSALLANGPQVGAVNRGWWEGFRGITSVTGAFPASAVYDLAGAAIQWIGVGAGAPGASYIMTIAP